MKLSRDEKKLVIAALTNDLERVKSTVLSWELRNLRKKFERALYTTDAQRLAELDERLKDVTEDQVREAMAESSSGNGMSPT